VDRKKAEREDSFVAQLTENQKILMKVANAYCRSRTDRDELVAETTAALWKSFERFDESRKFSTWMYRIALNVAISFSRAERRRSEHRSPVDVGLLELAAGEPEPDERLDQLNDFIAALGDIDKALMLLYLDEHDQKNIATMLGLTETNVATKIGRLKARARIALGLQPAIRKGESHGTR
jgi:RNA polymerase sigma factor (sigma-70 family)